MIIGRRKFFSFFGAGVAMLAKPDLFIPKKEIVAVTASEFSWVEGPFDQITMEMLQSGSFNLHVAYALAE